jgi:excisionase family DNA binding protein
MGRWPATREFLGHFLMEGRSSRVRAKSIKIARSSCPLRGLRCRARRESRRASRRMCYEGAWGPWFEGRIGPEVGARSLHLTPIARCLYIVVDYYIMSGELLTVREVARRCHRSEETVRRWIWSGKLPAKKLGNQLFISATEADRLPRAGVTGSVTRPSRRSRQALLKQIDEDQKLADEMFARYGLLDVAELVRQVREADD